MSDERRDVRAVTRTYEKDGETKNFYQTVGTAWVSEHGSKISLQLEALPINKEWDGRLYINKPYEPKDKDLTHEFNKIVTDKLPDDKEVDKPVDLSKIPF